MARHGRARWGGARARASLPARRVVGGATLRWPSALQVEVVQVDASVVRYPELSYRAERVGVDYINRLIGASLAGDAMAAMLTRMLLRAECVDGGSAVLVEIPPVRHDVIHACDIAEDVAIAFGYNNVKVRVPRATPGHAARGRARVPVAEALASRNSAPCQEP